MIRFGNGKYIHDTPTRKELERFTIDELINIARACRSIKKPFKKILIDYVMTLGDLSK